MEKRSLDRMVVSFPKQEAYHPLAQASLDHSPIGRSRGHLAHFRNRMNGDFSGQNPFQEPLQLAAVTCRAGCPFLRCLQILQRGFHKAEGWLPREAAFRCQTEKMRPTRGVASGFRVTIILHFIGFSKRDDFSSIFPLRIPSLMPA